MNETRLDRRGKILAFTALVEIATGLVLIVDPAVVVRLLLGVDLSGVGSVLGRCFGMGVLALGLSCWPSRQRAGNVSPAVRAMVLYNTLIGLYLAYLAVVRHMGGLLLWPGVALHAAVVFLLVWTGRRETVPAEDRGTR